MSKGEFHNVLTSDIESGSSLTLRDILTLYLARWYLFVVVMCVALCCAFLYLKSTTPMYLRSAEILIKDEQQGGSIAGAASELSNLGLTSSNTNVENEMRVLASKSLAREVVETLRLNINYEVASRWGSRVLYGTRLPVEVLFLDENFLGDIAVDVTLGEGREVELSGFVWYNRGEEFRDDELVVASRLLDTIQTPIGRLAISPTANFSRNDFRMPLHVTKRDVGSTVDSYAKRMSIELSGQKSTTIILSLLDSSPQRADEYIETLMAIYNENWLRDRSQITRSTDRFINERLEVIAATLGVVDGDISSFKSRNELLDVGASTSRYIEESRALDAEILELNTQLSMGQYIRDYLSEEGGRGEPLPTNSGLESANLASQIATYNALLLQRNRVARNSSQSNPLVVNFDSELRQLRGAIVVSLDNEMNILRGRLGVLNRREQLSTQRIKNNPMQEQELLTISRQQKVMESIYLYLLQKREENQLTQAFAAYNTRIINPPSGGRYPTSPVSSHVWFLAVVLGVFIPAVWLYVVALMNTTVRGRRDMEGMKITFLGEIPQIGEAKRNSLYNMIFRRQKAEPTAKDYMVVKPRSRNVINEAFRIVRTNLEFVTNREEGSKVIMTTSFNPGSGKTFVSLNLAASFAVKGSRVLILDLDMRKATISNAVCGKGFKYGVSSYLNHSVEDLNPLIVSDRLFANLDILPVGALPPNPTELLLDGRFAQMMETLRAEYDYIFVDCPPSEVVADVAIVNKFVDQTLYVVRVGNLERCLLGEIDRFYTEGRYKNVALILNGSGALGGGYGYGNYGYGYGYGERCGGGYTVED